MHLALRLLAEVAMRAKRRENQSLRNVKRIRTLALPFYSVSIIEAGQFMKTSVVAVSLAFSVCAAHAQNLKTSYLFDFGGKAAPGYTEVLPTATFNDDVGYGFEPALAVRAVNRGGKNALHDGFVTGSEPFFFSAAVPEGNYKVTVILGDKDGPSTTTVKAELRRLMLEQVETKPGKFADRTFIVNIRRPQISTGGSVRLKEREKTSEIRDWDDKLTLEFSGRQPKLCALRIEKVDDIPTIYIAGDSTSTDQGKEPYNSWGQMITNFFKPDIAVANNGESGESLRSYISEHRLAKVMSVIKPGDYLFIQMGHNDQKEKGPDVGAFTTYTRDLKLFVAEARKHGATPVLITPMNRRTFDANGKVTKSLGDFPQAVRNVAKEDNVALIDLNAMSKILYEAFGPEGSGVLFAGADRTHHSDFGSYELAKCIIQGIREAKLPIAKDINNQVPPFNPAHPDSFQSFDVPRDLESTTIKPYGN